MIEDDDYRRSSQYRLWSFTADQLREQREETNSLASEKVRQLYSQANGHGNISTSSPGSSPSVSMVDTLTVDEELRIVQWGCEKISEMRAVLDPSPSSEIVATAIQYLRRFYLLNSAMTYHPKQITVCAMWLALKSCHLYFPLHRFLSQLGNITAEDVRAPEFLLMQALRFTLDVRHPLRSLRGGVADMNVHAAEISCLQGLTSDQISRRVGKAADKANTLLKTNAQITDVYFLYTPPQIWLAALYIADQELAQSYLDYLSSRLDEQIKRSLVGTVEQCAVMINSYKSSTDDKATKQELGRIGKKLRKCQNPEKVDIVAVAKAKAAEKREGNESDEEKRAKKRKLGAERKDRDGDVFGPGLNSVMK